jgi:excisionase family DNA binding protein
MLRTSERFPRRLIAERRIRFTRVGRHVRIPESALREFIAAGLVEPVTTKRKKGGVSTRHAIQGRTASTGQLRRPSRARPTLTCGLP